jgi:uncharacterized membrane protein
MSTNYRSSEVKFGDWISEGFRMFTEQWQVWVLQTLVVFAVIFGLMAVGFGAFMGFGLLMGQAMQEPQVGPLFFIIFAPFVFIFWAASLVLTCGMYKTAFKQLQGGKIQVSDVFSAMDCLGTSLLASLCTGALVMVGFVLCVIPGIIIAGMLHFTIPLIVHKRLGVFDAMAESKELVRQNLLMFILFQFVVQLIAQSGQYACYVGLLATFPLQFTMGVIAYRDCFGVPGARGFQPRAPANPASYSGPQGWRAPEPGASEGPASPQWPPSAVPPQPAMCSACGTALPPGARFCPACGGTA